MNRRRWKDRAMSLLCLLAVGVALLPLLGVLSEVVSRGLPGLTVGFFTGLPLPVGEVGGGFGNAIQGTLAVTGLAVLLGMPAGVLAGLYLSESSGGRFPFVVRFAADVLTGVPSIVAGLFGYVALVQTTKHFSILAGAVALAFILLPFVTRATEDAVRMVPGTLREAALALGAPRWRVTLQVVLASARAGVITGGLLAVARIIGETAPLLFTAFNSRFWMSGLDQPVATLPVQIFTYAISPFRDWQAQAWAGALVLVVIVMGLSAALRYVVWRRFGGIQT